MARIVKKDWPKNNPTAKGGFKKGQSGNPKGRPRGMTMSEKMRARLACLAKGVPWAEEKLRELGLNPDTATIQDVFIDATIAMAIRADGAAFSEVWDRHDGTMKNAQVVKVNGEGEKLSVEVTYRDKPSRADDSD